MLKMKTIGLILITGGILLMIYALMFMDTSIAVDYQGGNSFGLPERVNNLGLMAQRQNYMIASGVSIIIGLVLFFLPTYRTENIPIYENENKKCSQCAEQVRKEAKICRFCNYTFTEEELKETQMEIEQNELDNMNISYEERDKLMDEYGIKFNYVTLRYRYKEFKRRKFKEVLKYAKEQESKI